MTARPFHEQLAALAAESPARLAVESGAERLSYGELDARANQLARRLAALGVDAETLVAIDLGSSTDWVVALLGVWKAGGAYLALDPEWPAARRALVLEDARPRLVIDRAWLSAEAARIAGESASPVEAARRVRLAQLAYVLYTSGSTGRP